MMPISIARIVIAVLLVVVWIVVVAAGYRWIRPRGQVIGRRYLAVAVPTGAVVAAAAIVLLLAGSPWLAGLLAIVLVLYPVVVYRQLRRGNANGTPDNGTPDRS
jgi:hypothetical protein